MIIVTGILCYLGMLPLRESLLVAIIGAALRIKPGIWWINKKRKTT